MENTAQSLSGLKREDFQKVIQGKQVDLYFLHNANGMEVAVTNYGGSLVAIMVPDRNGNYANVIQGHDNIDDCFYLARKYHIKSIVIANSSKG